MSESVVDFDVIAKILQKHKNDPSKIIPILQDVQKEFRYLPKDALLYIATTLNIPPSKVYGVATFFSHFTLEPKGKNIIKICDGTACHVKKSGDIIKALKKRFLLKDKKVTSDDGFITVETVSCLGACGLAPVIVLNDEVHGDMTLDKVMKLMDDLEA
ncbi:MAG: NAD(P)H-dependent oxidoreductase subunit E [bacterium]|nr:NAD(P)H-dependent oxidoreductase subunit E [bacterium]